MVISSTNDTNKDSPTPLSNHTRPPFLLKPYNQYPTSLLLYNYSSPVSYPVTFDL